MENKYNHLVLCSGGTHLFATIGLLHSYHVNGILSSIKKFSSCGSASVIALALACGISPGDITIMLVVSDIFEANQDPKEHIEAIFNDKLVKMFGRVPSLLELKELTDNTLYLEAYNTTTQSLATISHLTHPQLSCVTACCLSYNTPYKTWKNIYCGNEYINSSMTHPVPNSNTVKGDNTLCIYTLTNSRTIGEINVHTKENTHIQEKSIWCGLSSWSKEADSRDKLIEDINYTYKLLAMTSRQHTLTALGSTKTQMKCICMEISMSNYTSDYDSRVAMLSNWKSYMKN